VFVNRARSAAPACRLLLLYALVCAVLSPAVATFLLVVARRSDMTVSLTLVALRNFILWVVCFREL
jgi:hypothetical protein